MACLEVDNLVLHRVTNGLASVGGNAHMVVVVFDPDRRVAQIRHGAFQALQRPLAALDHISIIIVIVTPICTRLLSALCSASARLLLDFNKTRWNRCSCEDLYVYARQVRQKENVAWARRVPGVLEDMPRVGRGRPRSGGQSLL